jgi:hypothetical protein
MMACYSPRISECSIQCSTTGACPSGMSCLSDNYCHESTVTLCLDQGGGPDAGRADAPTGGPPDARGGGADAPVVGTRLLTIVGDSNLSLSSGDLVQISARLTQRGAPVSDTVTFQLVGDARDSGLVASSAPTDGNGIASDGLSAGSLPASFAVVASAPGAASVSWTVQVSPRVVHAHLRIVGDAIRTGAPNTQLALAVQYLDDQNRPLAGTVTFVISGEAHGAKVTPSAQTDASGTAHATLTLGSGPATFQVTASAPNAQSVSFTIFVTPQQAKAAGT